MTSVEAEVRELGHFIGGEWVERRRAPSRTPTRSPARRSRGSPPGRGRTPPRAVAAAAAAAPGWAQSAAGRAPADLPRRRPTSSRAGATRSSRGSPARRAARSASGCSRWASCPASSARRRRSPYAPLGTVIPSDNPGTLAMGIRKPVGVVGAIAPWNAALILSARSIAAPLALGNTVVLKPSEWSPYVGRPALGRDLRRGGAAGGRAEHRHARARRGGADRRRARREPGRAAASTSRARPRPGAGSRRRRGAS